MSEQDQVQVSAEGEKNNGAAQRRSSWQASMAAISYLAELSRQPELKIRTSDRVTGISVMVATLTTVLCLVLHKMSGINFQFLLLCDLFLGISLTLYVGNRLGILTALPPRQAALTWQLLQAFAFVGVFITVNMVLFFSLVLSLIAIAGER